MPLVALPVLVVIVAPLPVSVAYRPADGPDAGGGFYDAFELGEDQVALVVGRVEGGGATLSEATFVRHAVRGYLKAAMSARQTVETLRDRVAPDLDGTATLGQHAVELSRTTGVEVEVVEQAALRLGHTLMRAQLLDGPWRRGLAAPTPVDDTATFRYVPVPPSTCQSMIDQMSWVRTMAVGLGGYNIGIRADSERAAEILADVLSSHLVDDERVPANFSVRLALATAQYGGKRLSVLYEGCQLMARSRVARRTLHALLEHLSWYVRQPERELLAVDATVVVRGREAVLLPSAVRVSVLARVTELSRRGLAVLDAPAALVDPVTGELVVRAPAIDVDSATLAELQVREDGTPEPALEPGRYTLTACVFEAREKGEDTADGRGEESVGAAVLRVLPSVVNARLLGPQQTLDMVATALSSTRQETVAAWDTGQVGPLLSRVMTSS